MTSTPDPLADERMLDREGAREDPALWTAASPRAVVASAHYLATRAGRRSLERGGNAVDAAVTAALALAVCEPAGSGLGGMATATIHHGGRTVALEGACRAPGEATPERVAAGNRYRGHAAAAVPMQVAAVAQALRRYGRLGQAEVLEPAIELAREGVPLTPLQARLFGQYGRVVEDTWLAEELAAAGGARPGAVLRQPALARTLERLAREGFEDFYRGGIARRIVEASEAGGGFLREADLRAVEELREPEPLRSRTAGGGPGRIPRRVLCTPGPPAGGATLVELWHLCRAVPGGIDPGDPRDAARLAALIARARRDRREPGRRPGMLELGDAAALLELDYAEAAARETLAALPGAGETTHVSAMDAEGNAVAWTQSIERSFGAGVGAPDLGFFLNGYLRAFKVQSRSHPHYLRPGAVARSNAAPTIVLEDGAPAAAIGSTGSERMVSGILQALLRLDRGQTPFEAVHAPRLHATPEGLVRYEARLPAPHLAALERAGFATEELDAYAFAMGGMQLVARTPEGFVGVGEPRRDGAAAGPRE